jgi:hypothetical protein
MLKLGDLHDKFGTVCEIGADSRRFAEEVIAALHPDRYEIYETAGDWLPWLSRLPGVMFYRPIPRESSAARSSPRSAAAAHGSLLPRVRRTV